MRLRAPALALLVSAVHRPPPRPAPGAGPTDGLVVNAAAAHVRLRVLSENAIRVVAWPVGSPEPRAAVARRGRRRRPRAGSRRARRRARPSCARRG